ncbi:hypothetical protein Fcan01_22251 [Folsomia candida]|uniref:Uncharacterized protein n=2 Tax=Folsomia candida TaxID=158441 RepID=A0A226DDB3_FOLCA|nr:hypothetical protein Fcan01_22251 [Folsomia candida]
MCEELRKKYNELDKLWTGKSKRKRKTAFPTNTIGIRELIRNDRSKNRGTHLPCSTMHKIVSFAKLKRKVNFAKYVVSSSSSSSMPTTPMRTRKSSGGSGGTSGGRSHSLTWPRFVIKSKAKEEGGKKTVEKMGPDLNNNDNVATEDVDNITEDDDNVSEDVPNTMEDYANDFLDCRDGEEAIKSTPITTTWSHSSRQVLSTILGDMSLSSSESRQDNVEIPPKTRARSSSRSSREVKIVTTSSAKIRSKTASSSTGRSSHHHLGVPTKRSSLAHHPYQFRQPHQHHHHQPMSSYAYLLSKSQPLSIPPPPGFPPRPPQQQQQQQHSFNFGVMPAPQAQRHQQNLPTPQPEVEKQPYNHIPMTQQDMARKADLMFSQVMGVHYSHGHYSQWSPNSSFVGDNCSSSSSSSGGGYQNLNALPNMSSPQNNPYVRYQQQHNQYHGQNYSLLQIAQQSQQKLGLSPAPPPQQQQQQQFMPMMFSPQTGSGGPQNMNNNQPPPPRPLGWFCPAQQQPQPQQIQIPPPQQKKCVFLQRPQHGPMTNIYNPAGGIPPGGQTLGGMMIPSRIHYWQDVQDHNSRQQQHQHAVRNARVCYLNTVPQGQGQQQQQGQCQGQQVPFITQGNNVMLLSPPRHGVKTPHFHQQSSPQRHHKTSLRSVSSTGSILDPRPARQHKSPKSFTLWSDSTSTSSASSSDPPTPTGQPRSPDVGEGQSQGQSQDLSEDGDDVGLELLLP